MRRTLGALMLCALIGCSGSPAESTAERTTSSPDAFAGSWRSVTPSLEFIGLTVVSKSSQQGVMGARLTLSGVAWEGNGRIEGDSLRLDMAIVSAPSATGVMVLRFSDPQTLRLQTRPASALDVAFVREH